MAVALSYPGVYIEEIPSGVRTITGVSTSVTAFVGYTAKGPVNLAVKVYNFGDFTRAFGGLARNGEVSYAVQQFFLNGGSQAWIVRVADNSASASVILESAFGTPTLLVEAASAGAWGNLIHVDVDYATTQPDSTFNLTVTSFLPDASGTPVLARTESYPNLSMDTTSSQNAVSVVNASSQILQLTSEGATTANNGFSLSGDLSALASLDDNHRKLRLMVDGNGPYEVEIFQPGQGAGLDHTALATIATKIATAVTAAGAVGFTCVQSDALGTPGAGNYLKLVSPTHTDSSSVQVLAASTADAAPVLLLGLANAGRGRPSAADLRPAMTGTTSGDLSNLLALPSTLATLHTDADQMTATLTIGTTSVTSGAFSLAGTPMATLADLAARIQAKIQTFGGVNQAFATTTVSAVGRQLRVVPGVNADTANITFANSGGGTLATTTLKLTGAGSFWNVRRYQPGVGPTLGAQAGAVPGADGTPPADGTALIGGTIDDKTGIYALEDVDIFNLLCIPITSQLTPSAPAIITAAMAYCVQKRAFYIIDPPAGADSLQKIQAFMSSLTPATNGAIYFPMLQVPDPLDKYNLRNMPPSGTLAGLYARTDGSRGVWKAPAGTDATLINVQGLSYNLTDMECGALNQLGINCLRVFPVYGRVAWGARTLIGADGQTPDWKYTPVRRVALYIEESLFRGTQWVVFEPNDEPLWSQIRLNLGAFMQGLFRQGAFQGKTPQEAYFVKCDSETTTQDDINNGVVNIVVGFAPLKPAEFVVIQIQQIAGQIGT